MTVLATLPRKVYAANTYPIPSFPVPQGIQTFKLTFTRNAWPNIGDNVISANFEFSYDNGQTWTESLGPFTAWGGVTIFRGVVDPLTVWTFPAHDPTNSQRRIRGTVTTLIDLDTQVTVEGF